MRVLMVCTGNQCRSPMAAALMKRALRSRGCSDIEVSSAGTQAAVGAPATELAIGALRVRGVDISEHLSTPLTERELLDADLVVAMSREHVDAIADVAPEARAKVLLLKEAAEMTSLPADAAGPRARLEALLSGTRPEPVPHLDIADPIGRPRRVYEHCAAEIAEATEALAAALCGGSPAAESRSPQSPET
jgi:protein-tyrosine phosphatase